MQCNGAEVLCSTSDNNHAHMHSNTSMLGQALVQIHFTEYFMFTNKSCSFTILRKCYIKRLKVAPPSELAPHDN